MSSFLGTGRCFIVNSSRCHEIIGIRNHTIAVLASALLTAQPAQHTPLPPFTPSIATMHSPYSWNHVLYAVSAMLVAATLAPGVASTVVSGCAGAASATEANAFFTISGSSVSGVNGCYAMFHENGDGSGSTCAATCAAAGLGCVAGKVTSTADCAAAIDWYLASSARRADIPASPGFSSWQVFDHCGVENVDGGGWGRVERGMQAVSCTAGIQGAYEAFLTCKCTDPVLDTTAPSLSDVLGSQASPSAVTVTGTVDEPSTVYCNVAASGHDHTPANVKAAGFSDSVSSSGSFTVTVTGVSGEGTKSVACVGEDSASNLGATVSSGSDFLFGTPRLRVAWCPPRSFAELILAFAMHQQTPPDPP